MSTPSGYTAQTKDERLTSKFVTVQPLGSNRYGLDVSAMVGVQEITASDTIDDILTDSSGNVIGLEVTAHGGRVGDVIKYLDGNAIGREPRIIEVVDANIFFLGETLDPADAPVAGDTFSLLRPTQASITTSGAIVTTPGPMQFVLDGVDTEVEEDTGTPANNRPLPVKIMGTTGPINITAGDLNVQTTHVGAGFDSVRIGDGTDLLAINADGSINASFTATDLDIRDLDAGQDNVAISDGTDVLGINNDGSINAVVTATALDIRPLDFNVDSVFVTSTAFDIRALDSGTDSVAIGGIVAVDATDLDIRDLDASQDTIAIGDGSDLLAINADGSINALVTATNLDIRDLTHASDSVRIGDGTDLLAINADGSINVAAAAESVVDFLDTPILAGSSINGSGGLLVQVVASTAAATKKIQVCDTTGDFLGWYTGAAASEVLRAITGPGFDGILPFNVASGTRVTVRGMETAVSGAGSVSVNFIG